MIGTGGMGVVYGATDDETGDDVALKALPVQGSTAMHLRRFRREAQIASSVKHRYVCEVKHLGVDRGRPFIVMERLHGETLRQRLRDSGALSAIDAVTMMLQILEGLSAAHAAGVLHRDVKPSNVFVTTPRGSVPAIKIIDFGLAKLLPRTVWKPRPEAPPEELSAITTADVIPGTPSYLAPEQVAGGNTTLDERVDVWAAGLTFFEMLVGRRAFHSSSYAGLAADILLRALPSLSAVRDDVPVDFDRVLAKALAKDRSTRFRSATAFRTAVVEAWARFRIDAVARGERSKGLRKEGRVAPRRPAAPEYDVSAEDETQIDVDVVFDPDG